MKRKPPKGYDSWLEYELHTGPLDGFLFHPDETLQYSVIHDYEPDFVAYEGKKKLYVESKGRFRDRPEATKYIWIAKTLGRNQEIVFIFENPKTPMPFAKRRKNGTKQTVTEWAESHGFRWFTPTTIPHTWRNN